MNPLPISTNPRSQYCSTPAPENKSEQPYTAIPTPIWPESTTLSTLKRELLAAYDAVLGETANRIVASEVADEDLRRQLEDQLIQTLLPFQDIMIPGRRDYAAMTSITQTFYSLAHSVEASLQERDQDSIDIYDDFCRL